LVVHQYFPHIPHIGDCAGDLRVAMCGLILLASHLGLFANVQPLPREQHQSKIVLVVVEGAMILSCLWLNLTLFTWLLGIRLNKCKETCLVIHLKLV
jgi:hypothetical protein